MNGDSPIVYGDGTQTREFTYIEDIVNANVRLITESAADGGTLKIGSTDNIEILVIAEEIRNQPAPELDIGFADRHDADAEHIHSDIWKKNELLKREPSRELRYGVEDFVE